MKSKQSILDVLWEYVDTFNPYASEDEKKILGIVAEKSNNFKNTINESQYLIFEDYQNSLWELCSIEQKEAFIKGIKFAVKFIIEAISDD